MRIAYFCKRQYMRQDVLDNCYGRLYVLPWQLAARGHLLATTTGCIPLGTQWTSIAIATVNSPCCVIPSTTTSSRICSMAWRYWR